MPQTLKKRGGGGGKGNNKIKWKSINRYIFFNKYKTQYKTLFQLVGNSTGKYGAREQLRQLKLLK